jgi:monothiol glutaredoxin
MSILETIDTLVKETPIVLFMKGTRQLPQCGFSATVVQVLNLLNVDFKDMNILTDPELRQGIKDYANWPTIPQLYIKGEFVGGCDIVREMYQSGELQTFLQEKGLVAA